MTAGRVPSVTVGITTRNRANVLPKAIASALAQDYPNVHVAIFDDGSTDNTPSLRAEFPQVRWERRDQPLGIIEARNHLMRTAATDYYLSLDDDAWFMQRDEMRLAISRLEAERQVAAIAFDILSPDRPREVPREAPRLAALFIGCGHVLRLSAAREAGFYALSPGTYGAEEKDLSLRLANCGYRIELMPGVHVWHDKAWQDRDHYPIHRSGVCNELVVAMRRCPAPEVFAVLPQKIASFAWFWLRHPAYLRAGLAGAWLALRSLPQALRTRSAVRREVYFRNIRPQR